MAEGIGDAGSTLVVADTEIVGWSVTEVDEDAVPCADGATDADVKRAADGPVLGITGLGAIDGSIEGGADGAADATIGEGAGDGWMTEIGQTSAEILFQLYVWPAVNPVKTLVWNTSSVSWVPHEG